MQRDPIWAILEHKGIPLSTVARKVRYSEGYVRAMKCGDMPTTPEARRRLAEYLDLPEESLFLSAREEVNA